MNNQNIEYFKIYDNNEITQKQKEILKFIYSFLKTHHYSPTINEIALYFKINIKTAYEHINRLEKKELIVKKKNKSRSIQLTNNALYIVRLKKIPIIGSVAAGSPIFSEIDITGELAIDIEKFPKGEYFSLKVVGYSMKDAGILEGDYVIVKIGEEFNNNDIIVAMIEGEVTIKRIIIDKNYNQIILHPENENMDDIIVNPDELRIIGKVVGIQRFYN